MRFWRRAGRSPGWSGGLLMLSIGLAAVLGLGYASRDPSPPRTALGRLVFAVPVQAALPAQPGGNPVSLKACLANNGLAYSPFRDGQGTAAPAPFASENQIAEDLGFLSQVTQRIRTYASGDKYSVIPFLAKKRNIKVIQGVYLGGKKAKDANEVEINSAVDMARNGFVDAIIVGNETLGGSGSNTGSSASTTLSDSQPTKEELVSYIREVKEKLSAIKPPVKVPVTTAQLYSAWEDNLDVAREVDFVVAHFYPFWDGKPISEAAPTLFQNYDRLKSDLKKKFGRDIEVVIGETGWPSAGSAQRAAIPSAANAKRYLQDFMTTACERNIHFYYFEAFDEEWKWGEGQSAQGGSLRLPSGDRTFSGRVLGSSWGLFGSDGTLKPELKDLFSQPPRGSRAVRDIFGVAPGTLSAFYDLGVDTGPDRLHEWCTVSEEFKMAYPAGQEWGTVFISVGTPTPPPRPWKDFSGFTTLSMELRGNAGGEEVEIGVLTRSDPGTGKERRVIQRVTDRYEPVRIPLRSFESTHLSYPDGLKQLYVVVEFVFHGARARTVYAKNIRYE